MWVSQDFEKIPKDALQRVVQFFKLTELGYQNWSVPKLHFAQWMSNWHNMKDK